MRGGEVKGRMHLGRDEEEREQHRGGKRKEGRSEKEGQDPGGEVEDPRRKVEE